MSNVTTFKFNDLPVRIVEKDGKPLFVIRDICNILGFSNPNRQLAVHTENKPLYERISTPGGLQVVRLVPREDVEKILAPNRGRKAAALRRWLRTEVYPKVFPEVAAGSFLFVILDLSCPTAKEKAARHENR
ncbi:hypothetical protein C5Q97_04205 [Victivallales bacterium CCUG 44730]|nr:hypothetical protein C5Q97_04205 [Victivallales bacterium CCUG 44730]